MFPHGPDEGILMPQHRLFPVRKKGTKVHLRDEDLCIREPVMSYPQSRLQGTRLTPARHEGVGGVVFFPVGATTFGVSGGGVISFPSKICCSSSMVKSMMDEVESLDREEEPVEVATGLGRAKVETIALGST
ncbi:hypothetical protein GOODEAATRI_032374 [Goodea atripinnis]|uniref:Uncharacterized protein n=1 Tax=Goodea atripinnis TaxID=208336 RepID=A0ABV0NQ35_9TELE